MDLYLILLGIFIGLLIAGWAESSQRKLRATQNMRPNINPRIIVPPTFPYNPPEHYIQRRVELTRRLPEPSRLEATPNRRSSDLLENWRKSIVGLIKLADSNLQLAQKRLETGDYIAAAEVASTSVENVARALIHCFGGKPDTDSGQEEALKMLCGRFQGAQRTEFEKAIETVSCVSRYKIDLRCLSANSIQSSFIEEAGTRKILECTSTIICLFKQLMIEHFATEIPELSETCPKCHSLNISVLCFDMETVRHECNLCHHKWNEPRT